MIYIFDLLGTLVFAISGVMAAVQRKFDLVGALVLGFVTAVGGGSLRDMLIGQTPVSWMNDTNYLLAILAALPLCYFFKDQILKLRKGLFIFDTIGIALFTILGMQKTLLLGLSPIIALLMGIVTAVFGGIIRDVLSNRVPLIFRKEIYASACFIGGSVYLFLHYLLPNHELNMILPTVVVFAIRYYSVKRNWSLPFQPIS